VACFLLVGVGLILVGTVYMLTPRFMPYHSAAIGRTWDELDAQLQVLLLGLIKGGGGAAVAVGLALVVLTWVPLREGRRWARRTILAVGLCAYVPLLYVTLEIQLSTPASSPWYAVGAAIVVLLAGYWLGADLDDSSSA
jgi:hypothetical protein